MRKIRDVLRLNAEGLSNRKIAVSLGIGRTTIGDTVRRAQLAGLNWPLPSDLTDDALEQRLFPVVVKAKNPSLPDWAYIHRERRRPGVTLLLLWEEYRSAHPDGFGAHAVLRALSSMAGQAVADHAADPYRRREDVRRLCRPNDSVH